MAIHVARRALVNQDIRIGLDLAAFDAPLFETGTRGIDEKDPFVSQMLGLASIDSLSGPALALQR